MLSFSEIRSRLRQHLHQHRMPAREFNPAELPREPPLIDATNLVEQDARMPPFESDIRATA